ncbi:MAG TPA: ABC transporter ATP-binding protein [Myxococcota bacterium]|nr:ABC transporter ATP-binding protein [Myxococcota bacterium]
MIIANDLQKSFGDVHALDGVSFQIDKGECVGLLGLNGAGKTTLLRILGCLLTPTAGTMTVDGRDVGGAANYVRGLIGFLPEEPPLYNDMRVGAFLGFAAGIRGIPRTDIGGRVQDAARRCQLDKMIDARIETLSFGYRKRVGIAQAIVHNPPLVILDEPIGGLDPAQIVEMRELVRGLRGQHTVVISSHILTEISQTCDRIMVMQRGKLVGSGTEEELTGGAGKEQHFMAIVRGEKPDVEKALAGVAGVTSIEIEKRADGALDLRIEASEDVRALLSRALVQGGLDLIELARKSGQLEATFLRLTGDKEDER